MSVSLHEHKLGGLRWIVLNGRGETLDALGVPAADLGPSWFLRVLTSPPPGGVRSDPQPGGRGLTTLCTFVADLTAGRL